jgi:hypothetical protein
MTNREKKIVSLLEEGFSYETIKKMSDTHINLLYNRLVKEAVVRVAADKYDEIKDKLSDTDTVEVTEEDNYFDSDDDNQEIIDILFGEKKPYKRSRDIKAMKLAKKHIKPHYYKPGYHGDEDIETSMEYAIGVDDPKFMMDEGKKKMKTPITTLGMFEGELKEKSVSRQQQKLMGLALSVKRGETPKSGVSKKVLDMVNSMTEKELEDFASTKHKGLPKKKKETKEGKVRQIEESIVSLIKKSQGKVITKSDILQEAEPRTVPKTPTIKPSTKPERGTPYQPKHSPKPKAGTEVKPARPTVKPGTKPERGTPYQPKHSPKPKAGNEGRLPEFLTFNNLNIKFRDE